jgi:hypothetical protein
MPEEKTKRVNSYNLAIKEWNEERKSKGFKWSSPKKGTAEYEEVQAIKKRIEDEKEKPVKEVKNVVSFKVEDMKADSKNVKKRDDYNNVVKKLMKTNTILTERIVEENDTKKVLELVAKLKENTLMLTKARQLKQDNE